MQTSLLAITIAVLLLLCATSVQGQDGTLTPDGVCSLQDTNTINICFSARQSTLKNKCDPLNTVSSQTQYFACSCETQKQLYRCFNYGPCQASSTVKMRKQGQAAVVQGACMAAAAQGTNVNATLDETWDPTLTPLQQISNTWSAANNESSAATTRFQRPFWWVILAW
ncbi:hypothetical protein RI367_008120 [Sorochytrium milnesiophthora]